MGRARTEAQDQVADLLRTAKDALGLSLTFLSRMDGETQHLEVVETSLPFLRDGMTQRQQTSICQAILDDRLPAVIPDIAAHPEARALPAARYVRIRSFVSVPVVLSDGSLYGTFCAAGFRPDPELAQRDKSLMDVLARAAAAIIEPGVQASRRAEAIHRRLEPVLSQGGPSVVLQPIVALATGQRVGAEALSRFPEEWAKAPDACFEEAHSVGEGIHLELLAIERAASFFDLVDGYIAVNVSPAALFSPEGAKVLAELAPDRLVVELSEHDAIEDYARLTASLEPLRRSGVRLAIDDVGAGFSSLRHIVQSAPDIIKLDRSIVAGVAIDPVLRTLVRSMVEFGHGCGAKVVAEGIETAEDAAELTDLGVDHGQGWYFGRPGPPESLGPVAAPEAPWPPVSLRAWPTPTSSPVLPTSASTRN